ncbi:hypothetical protein [Maribellus sp. YY47]|uniref:hypothetical protein n=1 Tax=Maribellus sp. YY47 TaxID=2929486 RepID=UPI002000BE60|nr:hypothetical protein [Maribellus sp. YY47]MCK3684161.1 hypothetical protein [Maribellus sp. YY47]
MKSLPLVLDLTPQISIPPLTANSVTNFISVHYLAIILSFLGIIAAAMICYFACSYLLMFWNQYMGIDDKLELVAENDF